MKTISRYIMTLALLLTAATGAWAQGLDVVDYDIYVDFYKNYNPNETTFFCDIMNMTDPKAEIKGTLELSVDGDFKGSFDVDDEMVYGSIDPVDAGYHTWSAEFKPVGGGSFKRDGGFTINKATPTIYNESSTSINLGVGESTEVEVYIMPTQAGELSYSSSDASVASITKESSNNYIIEAKAAGTATITLSFAGNTNYEAAEDVKITVTVSTPPIKVTTDAAEEGATFTEASFDMPTEDVTVNYELVRDMSVKMTAEVGDGSDGYRIRIKKDGDDYVPVKAEEMLISVSDDLDEQHPIDLEVNTDFTLLAQKKVGGDTWADLSNEDKLSVGTFRYKVTGVGNYDGTIYSNEFQLFQGYEVVVPAGEYVTYYKDEPLYADPETSTDAELYTITSVSGDKAILSNAIETAPSGTPLLVYNKGTEEKTFLLIPANAEPNLALDVYDGFIGTMQPTVIPASNATTDNYAFNGKQFVWVMNEIAIGANKAYLSIPKTNGNPKNIRLYRGNGETTGIDASLVNSEEVNSVWYDLNGRRLQGKPSLKGVYIKNGKKVVVH